MTNTPTTAAGWDERYASAERIWSGDPNGALVDAAREWTPGTALDVGCGEGADTVWLARQGWSVTALELSGVALERAQRAAAAAGIEVVWVHAGLVEAGRLGPFDLVACLYPAVPRTPDGAAERALMDAVAPGGRLLFVHHEHVTDPSHAHGFDPSAYLSAASLLDAADGWRVEQRGLRERQISGGAGAHHRHDDVLVLRRPAAATGA